MLDEKTIQLLQERRKLAAFLKMNRGLQTKTADPMVRTQGRPSPVGVDTGWATWFGSQVRPIYEELAVAIPMLVKVAGPNGLLIGALGKTFGNPLTILQSMGFNKTEVAFISRRRLNIPRDLVEDVKMYRRPNVYWENPVKSDDAEECLARLQVFFNQAKALYLLVNERMENSTAKQISGKLMVIIKSIKPLLALVAKHGGLDQIASRLAAFQTMRGRPSALA